MFGKVPSKIAQYLKLENGKDSSATFQADSGADVLTLKRHGGWKSNDVAELYVEESVEVEKKIADLILRGESSIISKVVKSNTSDDRENVGQAVACAPVTQQARVRSPVGTGFLGEVFSVFFLTCKTNVRKL